MYRLALIIFVVSEKNFFSETTNMIKAKLYMNVHWMVLYKLYVFCSDMKFKMAATAGLSLRLLLNFFSDEQERIQKKTFTNWMNKYLKQVGLK
jgi:hypothetical protein